MSKLNKLMVKGVAISEIEEYILVLTDEKNRILTILINEFDAHSISLSLQGIKTENPMLYDLVKNLCDLVDYKITGAFIYDLVDGIFFTRVEFSNKSKKFSLDARLSDAVLLAINSNAPIYADPKLEKYFIEEMPIKFEKPLLN